MMNADWAGYYAGVRGRSPRREFTAALTLVPDNAERTAVDLGAGDGVESAALIRRGWRVLAVDPSPGLRTRVLEHLAADPGASLATLEARFESLQRLPRASFMYAVFALPFARPAELLHVIGLTADALRGDGVFAAHLFGERDAWASRGDVLTHDAAAAARLFSLFDVEWDEQEFDGDSGTGRKHWHIRFAIARPGR